MEDNIIGGPPIPEELLQNPDEPLYSLVKKFANNFLNSCYMIDPVADVKYSVSNVLEESTALACELQALGCKPGVVVGILSENRHEFAVVLLAVLNTGATLACFNPLYSIGELEHTLNITKPFIIFANTYALKQLNKTAPKYKSFKYVFDMDGRTSSGMALDYKSFLKRNKRQELIPPACNADSNVLILFSSGSTGLPKGVMLSNGSLVFLLKFSRYVNDLLREPDEENIILSAIPFFHGYGAMILLQTLICNSTVVIMKKFDEKLFLDSIQRYKVTSLSLVPPLMTFLAKHPLVAQYDLSSVKRVGCGAAPLSPALEETVAKKLKLDKIMKGYGMTETSVVCTSTFLSDNKLGTVGKPLFGMKMKIIDLQTGNTLGPNEEGEICFKGILLMKGYFNNEIETKNTIDKDGWLHTGDVGYYDDDGDLFIVDRIKDLIKYKGFQVAPAELESLLIKHNAVRDAAVIGIPDEIAGEIPRAFVVKSRPVTEQQIVDYISSNVAPHMRLRGGVTFVEEIPRNANGKILRKNLRNWIQSKL